MTTSNKMNIGVTLQGRMLRMLTSVAQSRDNSSDIEIEKERQIIKQSIESNISIIDKLVEGQSDLQNFIKSIQKIDWIDCKEVTPNIETIFYNKGNEMSYHLDISKDKSKVIKELSEQLSISTDSLCKMCIVKWLSDNTSEELNKTEIINLENTWHNIEHSLSTNIRKLVDQIFYWIYEDMIYSKFDSMLYLGELERIAVSYKELHNTRGYKIMMSYKRGKEVDEILQHVVQHVEKQRKMHK